MAWFLADYHWALALLAILLLSIFGWVNVRR